MKARFTAANLRNSTASTTSSTMPAATARQGTARRASLSSQASTMSPAMPASACIKSAMAVVVSCLCAEWCDTCVEYRPGFLALREKFPGVEFRWMDIEDNADGLGELADVENFPTIRVTRDGEVLFHGVQLPIHAHLERLLQELLARREK